MNFTEITVGQVRIKHFSVSSLIEISIKYDEPTETGGVESRIQIYILDYSEFDDLSNAIIKAVSASESKS